MDETRMNTLISVEPEIDFADGMVDSDQLVLQQDISLSNRIKEIREEKGLSIDQLSKSTGFGTQMLSDIENKKILPALGTVIKISKALDSTLGTLVHGDGDRRFVVTHKKDRKPVYRSTGQRDQKEIYKYMGLAPQVKNRHMEPLIVQLDHAVDEELSCHSGEEFIYILEGLVILNIESDLKILKPGDSVYYQSTTPHQISAQNEKAIILAVIYEGQ
ncbi:MAG: helix-turn-helix transcriptional regulator [Proteobacteria bacterium]|nr:helix-turn-helix transcriptional regulator [Pseudomonadota bacterium]